MDVLQRAAEAAVERFGGVRPASRVLNINVSDLSRLRNGLKTDVSDDVAKKLGVRRIVSFEPLNGSSAV